MSNADRNSFLFTTFIILVIISFFSLEVILFTDNRPSVINSFQKLVIIDDYCTLRNGSFSNITAPQVIVKEKVIEKPCKREGPWYAKNTLWHYPALFPRCSMDFCFNYSRCENMDDIKIFAYDRPNVPLIWYFQELNTTKWFTKNPHEACLLLVFVDTDPWHGPPPPPLHTLPHWNGGVNHVLVSFHDKWALTRLPMESIGMASLLITDMHQTIYRPGFDISITLPPQIRLTNFQHFKPFDRKYFLTFRGLRYLGHDDVEGSFRSHPSLRAMHNGKDIIVALSCRHPTNNYLREKEPNLGVNCTEDEAIYDKYNYVDLMNSTFGLAPAGRQPNSYRFTEILSAGTIPVLVADNYVKPFDTLIEWHRCILQFPTKQMQRIVPILRRMSEKEAEERQEYCLRLYREFLKDDQTLVNSAVMSLKARLMGFFSGLTATTQQ